MRPTPRSSLIHTIMHKTGLTKDGYGDNETWQNSQEVKYVRVESTSKLVVTKDNREVQLSLLLLHDCRNSLPAGEAYAIGDCVNWNDTDYTVMTVGPLSDNLRIHHYEIGLH